ncbi:MAG: hypothetical protein ABI323_11645 [Solirubrobacteraceae bacterium]
MRRIWTRALCGFVVAIGCAGLAPVAEASITPTVGLPSSPFQAASTDNLGVDLKFSPGKDSPKDMTLSLPPGLLANASIDGGSCLTSSTPRPACQVGNGTVSAKTVAVLQIPATVSVTFDLVAPPQPADLAGLAIMATNPITGKVAQLGSPGEITVQPSGTLNIAFHNIPDHYALVGPVVAQIAVNEINSTFDGLRMPTRCPSGGAPFGVTADSYSDSTPKSASAPLHLTGCGSLPFSPLLSVTAVKDSGDHGVQLTTDVTQANGQATSKTVGLGFPPAVVAPNAAAVVSGGLLCSSPTFTNCKTVGSAGARSPLYPRTLLGKVYLTGTLAAPAITISFPEPFALTLNGNVSLATNTTTFTGVPDIPLADLRVTLAGGPNAAFATTCATPSGNASGSFTSQNGDKFATSTSPFTISGCPPSTGDSGGKGGGGKTGAGSGSANLGLPSLASASLSGLRRGRPTLSFKLIAGRREPKLTSLTVSLPGGLSFRRHRVHGRLVLRGVSVRDAKVKRMSLRHGKLTITLARPSATVLVKATSRALHEGAGLRHKARRRRIRFLKLTLTVTTVTRQHVTVTRSVKPKS